MGSGVKALGKWVFIPWVGDRYTMGRGQHTMIWGRYTMGRGQNNMDRIVDIPWLGGQNTMGRGVTMPCVGVEIPCVRGSIYHG